jgi:HK97 family phage portal protein
VRELIPLDSSRMDVRKDAETGLLVFLYREGAVTREYVQGDILHIPGMGYDGVTRLKGMNPLAYMRQSLDLAASAETYGANYFRNNAAPMAYITGPNAISDKSKFQLLDYMMQRFGGVKNAGKLGILDGGMEIKTVPVNHTDMQYLELRKFQIEEIARAYRVPLHMIGELARSTNNNIEHQGLEWATNTIRPECTRIERRINMQLFGPRESAVFYAEFNLDALMRGDSAGRAAYLSAMRNIGVLNANEIRAIDNRNPYEGGEVYMVQGAMIPVAMAGQTQQKAVAQ